MNESTYSLPCCCCTPLRSSTVVVRRTAVFSEFVSRVESLWKIVYIISYII
jgi:hypothetical protein